MTFTQGTAYFFVVLGAIGLVEALDGDELMDLIALLCGLTAVASVVQFLIFPEPAISVGYFRKRTCLAKLWREEYSPPFMVHGSGACDGFDTFVSLSYVQSLLL